ncbi:MAG: copper chaperone PCu(A)C [Pseudomonadota bacterium]
MYPKKLLTAAALAALFPVAASAQMMVEDAFARASGPDAPTGAAFFMLHNMGDSDDRLVSASSDIAERVELHTHEENEDGLMQMIHVEEGFELPAGDTLMLERGGNHVMFLGLNQSLMQGDEVEVTLTFEMAEPITVMIPVDLERGAGMGHGGHGDHSGHGDMEMDADMEMDDSHDHSHDHNHDS